jgi:hypothetical protein
MSHGVGPAPFTELILAPTGRAACAGCKKHPDKKHNIPIGTIVVKSHYVIPGRNHFGASSTAFACMTEKRLGNLLEAAQNDWNVVQGYDALPPEAQDAVLAMTDCILGKTPIPDEYLRSFAVVPEKKPKRKRAEPPIAEPPPAEPPAAKAPPAKTPVAKSAPITALAPEQAFDIFAYDA